MISIITYANVESADANGKQIVGDRYEMDFRVTGEALLHRVQGRLGIENTTS